MGGWNLKFCDYAADNGSRDVVTALPNDLGYGVAFASRAKIHF